MTDAIEKSVRLLFGAYLLLLGGQGWAQEDLFPSMPRPEQRPIPPCTVTFPQPGSPTEWQRFAQRQLLPCERRCLAGAIDALQDPWNFDSSLAAVSLGHLAHQDATDALWESASNRFRDTETRIWSLEALAGIPHAEVIPRLIELLDDPRVAVDCLRELLLLAKNPLQVTEQEILDLCRPFYDYEQPPAGEGGYTIENRSAGYQGNDGVVRDHSPLRILAAHIGGHRSMIGRSSYPRLMRGVESYEFFCREGRGYGEDPYFVSIVLRNDIPDETRRKCRDIKQRYAKWWKNGPRPPIPTGHAYRYSLTHLGTFSGRHYSNIPNRLVPTSKAGPDSILRVLEDNIPLVQMQVVPLPWSMSASEQELREHYGQRPRISRRHREASSYVSRQFESVSGVPSIKQASRKLRSVGGGRVAELFDPLAPYARRIEAAGLITQDYGQDGFDALAAVAFNRFDHPMVRSACVKRVGELDFFMSEQFLLACASDPHVAAAAVASAGRRGWR